MVRKTIIVCISVFVLLLCYILYIYGSVGNSKNENITSVKGNTVHKSSLPTGTGTITVKNSDLNDDIKQFLQRKGIVSVDIINGRYASNDKCIQSILESQNDNSEQSIDISTGTTIYFGQDLLVTRYYNEELHKDIDNYQTLYDMIYCMDKTPCSISMPSKANWDIFLHEHNIDVLLKSIENDKDKRKEYISIISQKLQGLNNDYNMAVRDFIGKSIFQFL